MNAELISYYKNKAPEYDKIYGRPERQNDLLQSEKIQHIFSGKEVLEIGCGTGYWTEKITASAKSIVATDINETMLEIARKRNYPKQNVTFQRLIFTS